jgi:hypothetical protein
MGDYEMNKWGKTTLATMLALTVLSNVSLTPTAVAAATVAKSNIKIILDDYPLAFDVAPTVKNNVTLVPFRTLAKALGIVVVWDSANKAIRAEAVVYGVTRKVVLKIGQKTATVDGKSVSLLAAPIIINQQTLIPLNFFSTQFGAKVGWKSATQTVTIVSPKKKMHLRAFYALGSFKQKARITSMDSVAFGWSRINENGELVLDGADYNWPEAAGDITAESLVTDSAAQGAKPYLMVYSVDGKLELTKMLSDETLRNRSIDGMATLVEDNGFGGVLLDLEGLGFKLEPLAQQKLLNDYVKLLVEKLKPLGASVSIAVHPPNSAYKGYDYKTLASLVEDLVVMAYQYQPLGTPDHTPQPMGKVDEAITLMLKAGVPANKLILGIDLWSETTDSVDDKLGLAKRYGLKGASFWRLTFYDDDFAKAIDKVVEKAGN